MAGHIGESPVASIYPILISLRGLLQLDMQSCALTIVVVAPMVKLTLRRSEKLPGLRIIQILLIWRKLG
jgi:hypothetical protein